jgi:DHA2 family multidrug resistance protein
MAPRGAGTILMTPIITPLMRRCGLRPLMAAGIVITSLSVWMLGDMTLDADGTLVVVSGLLQGIASSLLWTPMTLLTYSTIPPDLRDQAAGFHILVRFLGTAIGISVLQTFTLHDAAETHAALAATAQLQNLPQALRDLAAGGGAAQMLSAVNAEVTRQAAMIAHVDSFRAVCLAQLATLPLLLLLRTPRPDPAARSKPA